MDVYCANEQCTEYGLPKSVPPDLVDVLAQQPAVCGMCGQVTSETPPG